MMVYYILFSALDNFKKKKKSSKVQFCVLLFLKLLQVVRT